jgi:hypothetical protein
MRAAPAARDRSRGLALVKVGPSSWPVHYKDLIDASRNCSDKRGLRGERVLGASSPESGDAVI